MFLLVLTAAIIATATYGGHTLGLFTLPSFGAASIVFLTLCTASIYYMLHRTAVKTLFVQLYLLTMVGKMIVYGAYLFIIILKDKTSAIGNVVLFLVTYFLFTILEVGFLYRRMTPKKGV